MKAADKLTLASAGHALPDGTRVDIMVRANDKRGKAVTLKDRLLKLAGTVDDLPSDMAVNHDHYIRGTLKR